MISKIYHQKQRGALDAFVRQHHSAVAVEDPLGGCMIALKSANIEKWFDGRAHFIKAFGSKEPMDFRPLLDLFSASSATIASTGSWLLGRSTLADLDLVVHDVDTGRRAADAIRHLLKSESDARLPGYWNRPYHHRRFLFRGREICVRCSTPSQITEAYTRPATYLGAIFSLTCQVVDDSLGHCTPSLYLVRVETGGAAWRAGDVLPLLSSESRHALAFGRGERLCLDGIQAFFSDQTQAFLVCQMGAVDGIRPY